MVQITAEIEGSRNAERISACRFAIEDWMPVSGVKTRRTLYPRPDSTAVARDITAGSFSLSRDEGEMNAMVAPGFNAGAVTGAGIFGVKNLP